MRIRWLLAIVIAAAASWVAFHFTGSSEVAYVFRSIVRHLVGHG